MFDSIHESVQNYTDQLLGKIMPGNAPVFSSEEITCEARVRAEIGQRLREVYKAEQPLPDRLADLVRRIGQLPEH